jgi:hypothetical protein
MRLSLIVSDNLEDTAKVLALSSAGGHDEL